MKTGLSVVVEAISRSYSLHDRKRVFTVAISGIDAAGKGYISKQVADMLIVKGYKVALIHADPWQTPISTRLQKANAAVNLYQHIFRWDDLFEQLIFPLQQQGSIKLETTGIHKHADIYYPLHYAFEEIDIILLEAVFLFKMAYLSRYDYRIWIECSFEEGLKRAIQRNAEQMDEVSLRKEYDTFYYAAQRYHFDKDRPKENADMIFDNN